MKLIPIYDETAPIACTITNEEVSGRVEVLERIRDRLARVDRTEHGLLLHFAPAAETESDLRQFAVDEKRCCGFWGFDVRATDTDLTLRWDAPPEAGGLVDALESWFTTDQPLSIVTGLL